MPSESFTDWLHRHMQPDRKVGRDGQTIVLKEERHNFRMEVKVDGVARSLVVMDFEQEGSGSTYFKDGEGFGQRCDFLIVDETPNEHLAYLIELKRKVPNKRGAEQLRWSGPFLRYIFSVFQEDTGIGEKGKGLRLRYFQLGNEYQAWVKKREMKRSQRRRFHKWDEYQEFDIFYSVSTGLKFREFKQ